MRALLVFGLIISIWQPAAFAQWPEPLRQALEPAGDGPNYLFDIRHSSTSANDETGEEETDTAYARIDMSQPELKQITPAHLIDDSLPGSSFSALAELENAMEDGIWCTRFSEDIPEDVELLSETSTTLTYGFTPIIPEDAGGPEKKIAKQMRAQITVSKTNPVVLSYSSRLRREVTLFFVFKIRKIEQSVTCRRAVDGRTYAAQFTSAFDGSGGGQSGGNNGETQVVAVYNEDGNLLQRLASWD